MTSASSSWLSLSTSSRVPAKGALNQEENESLLLKMVGNRKFMSAHSSVRLFWIGVPVSSSRCLDRYCVDRISASLDSRFFMRWPSSTMM